MRAFVTALALVAGPVAAQEKLRNPSFEDAGDAIPGWTVSQGARTDGSGASSKIVVDRATGALRFTGRADTSVWNMAEQKLAVRPGERVSVRARAKCKGVKREAQQFQNAHVHLMFVNAAGKRLAFLASEQLSGDRDWTTLVVTAIAPKGTTHLRAGLFFSMTGTMWFDDVKVTRAATEPFDKAVREAAMRDLAEHLGRTYTFFGYRGKPTLAELREKHEASVIAAKTREEFQKALLSMLGDMGDQHIWLKTKWGIKPTFDVRYPWNWNIYVIKDVCANGLFESTFAGEIQGFGYLGLPSFQLNEKEQEKLFGVLEKLKTAPGLVIDVRFNRGGNEYIAQKLAAHFATKRVLYAKNLRRDGDGFRESGERYIAPRPGGTPWTKPIVLLQSKHTVSSGEGFVAMMRMLDNVTTVGAPTRGASGNPQPFPLLPRLEVWSSTWRSLTPDGKCFEGLGLPPDIAFDGELPKTDPRLSKKDPLLEKAITILREKSGAKKK